MVLDKKEARAWAGKVAQSCGEFIAALPERELPEPKEMVAVTDVNVEKSAIKARKIPNPPKENSTGETLAVGTEKKSVETGGHQQVKVALKEADQRMGEAWKKASDEITVTIALRRKTSLKSAGEVKGTNAFGLFEYDVKSVHRGTYPSERILVAHMIVLKRRLTGPNRFDEGKVMDLTLKKLSYYSNLEKLELVNQLGVNPAAPIYVPKF